MRQEWEQAVARAVVERSFRVRLLRDPADVLADYGLGEYERVRVESLHATTLEQLVGHLLQTEHEAQKTLPVWLYYDA